MSPAPATRPPTAPRVPESLGPVGDESPPERDAVLRGATVAWTGGPRVDARAGHLGIRLLES